MTPIFIFPADSISIVLNMIEVKSLNIIMEV